MYLTITFARPTARRLDEGLIQMVDVPHPTVSVIIPTYNRALTLGRAVQSVLDQTFSDFELLVIDDGSTDETPEAMASYEDPRIQYLYLPQNSGVAHARNYGIKQARAELIAFLDSDDEWLPTKLERQTAYFAESEQGDLGLVFSAAEICNSAGKVIGSLKPPFEHGFLNHPFEKIVTKLFVGNFIWIGTAMMWKGCFEQLGWFAEDLSGSDEYEYWLRVAGAYRMAYVPAILARYWSHADSITGALQISGVAYAHRVLIAQRAAKRYPFLQPLLGERVAAWSRAHAHRLLLNGDYHGARVTLGKAIRHQPSHWPTYIAWLLAGCGGPGQQVYAGLRRLGGRA